MFDARQILAERWRVHRQRRGTTIADVLRSVSDAPSQSAPFVPSHAIKPLLSAPSQVEVRP